MGGGAGGGSGCRRRRPSSSSSFKFHQSVRAAGKFVNSGNSVIVA